MQVRSYFLDTDGFWHRLDIIACIVHKVVKELDISQNVETKSRRIPGTSETLLYITFGYMSTNYFMFGTLLQSKANMM